MRAQVGADHDGLDVAALQIGARRHLGVAEAVEGERRLEHLLAAGEHVGVGGLRRAQRADAQLPVLEHLGVPHDNLVARRGTADRQPDPADEVLAEVDERLCPMGDGTPRRPAATRSSAPAARPARPGATGRVVEYLDAVRAPRAATAPVGPLPVV